LPQRELNHNVGESRAPTRILNIAHTPKYRFEIARAR